MTKIKVRILIGYYNLRSLSIPFEVRVKHFLRDIAMEWRLRKLTYSDRMKIKLRYHRLGVYKLDLRVKTLRRELNMVQ